MTRYLTHNHVIFMQSPALFPFFRRTHCVDASLFTTARGLGVPTRRLPRVFSAFVRLLLSKFI